MQCSAMIICNTCHSNFEGLQYDWLIITIGKTICPAIRWGEWRDPNGWNPSLPGFGFGQRYHVDRHGQLTLKQLRLSVLNEMHTNSYSGPRLL